MIHEICFTQRNFDYKINYCEMRNRIFLLVTHNTEFLEWSRTLIDNLTDSTSENIKVVLTPKIIYNIFVAYSQENLPDRYKIVLPETFTNDSSPLQIEISSTIDYQDEWDTKIITLDSVDVPFTKRYDLKLGRMKNEFESKLGQRDELIIKLLAQIDRCAKTDEVYTRKRSDARYEMKGTSMYYTKLEADLTFIKDGSHYTKKQSDAKYQPKNTVQKLTHHDVLKWLHDNGCGWNEGGCKHAVITGRLDILKYLREAGCPWNSEACTAAVMNGHLDILKYLIEERCPWDCQACKHATDRKDILEYLHNKRCSRSNCFDCECRLWSPTMFKDF